MKMLKNSGGSYIVGSFRLGFVNLKARLGSARWFKSSAREKVGSDTSLVNNLLFVCLRD